MTFQTFQQHIDETKGKFLTDEEKAFAYTVLVNSYKITKEDGEENRRDAQDPKLTDTQRAYFEGFSDAQMAACTGIEISYIMWQAQQLGMDMEEVSNNMLDMIDKMKSKEPQE